MSNISGKNECEDPVTGLQGGVARMDPEMGEGREGRKRGRSGGGWRGKGKEREGRERRERGRRGGRREVSLPCQMCCLEATAFSS